MEHLQSVAYGFVTGRFIFAVADSHNDPDRLPDAVPAPGEVILTPLAASRVTTGDHPVTVLPRPVRLTTNDEGYLVDPAGAPGVWLVTGQYEVKAAFTGVSYPTFRIDVKPGHGAANPLDLTLAAPLEPSPAIKFVVNETVYVETLTARDEAVAAAKAATSGPPVRDVVTQELDAQLPGRVSPLVEQAVASDPRVASAQTTADTANAAASTASAKASEALTAAGTATTAAGTAQADATTAKAVAADAKTTAGTARDVATSAQATAASASSTASAADTRSAEAARDALQAANVAGDIVSRRGQPEGYAPLDVNGRLPWNMRPETSKHDIALGEVDNTADRDKPVSGPQRAAIDASADAVWKHADAIGAARPVAAYALGDAQHARPASDGKVVWYVRRGVTPAHALDRDEIVHVAQSFQRPASFSECRPAAHFTPPRDWMNDPQRPIFLPDGRWHLYYLYNRDRATRGNGTEWRHATSTDLVNWNDHGVVLEKYKNGLGDVQTGSTVVDTNNTAGFGAGAVIALATQQDAGVQRQSLWYSTDNGYTFTAYAGNPVMPNPGEAHWRDPKVIWDAARNRWVMLLAEGTKTGFYTSPDLKTWTWRSHFIREDVGMHECADLFQMSIDGDPNRTKWVLVIGINAYQSGRGTGTAYWIGDFDGEKFIPDDTSRTGWQWLDHGPDYYAAVTWSDSRETIAQQRSRRYSLAWMNSWDYAELLPENDIQGMQQSIAREVRLVQGSAAKPRLAMTPVPALRALEGAPGYAYGVRVSGGQSKRIPQPIGEAFRLELEIAKSAGQEPSEFRIVLAKKGEPRVTVGYSFATSETFVYRERDARAASLPAQYRATRTAPASVDADGVVRLDIVIDAVSAEVFANAGESSLSSLMFLGDGIPSVAVESIGGATDVLSWRLAPLAVVPPA